MAKRLGYFEYADRFESRVAMISKNPETARINVDAEIQKTLKKLSQEEQEDLREAIENERI